MPILVSRLYGLQRVHGPLFICGDDECVCACVQLTFTRKKRYPTDGHVISHMYNLYVGYNMRHIDYIAGVRCALYVRKWRVRSFWWNACVDAVTWAMKWNGPGSDVITSRQFEFNLSHRPNSICHIDNGHSHYHRHFVSFSHIRRTHKKKTHAHTHTQIHTKAAKALQMDGIQNEPTFMESTQVFFERFSGLPVNFLGAQQK